MAVYVLLERSGECDTVVGVYSSLDNAKLAAAQQDDDGALEWAQDGERWCWGKRPPGVIVPFVVQHYDLDVTEL